MYLKRKQVVPADVSAQLLYNFEVKLAALELVQQVPEDWKRRWFGADNSSANVFFMAVSAVRYLLHGRA